MQAAEIVPNAESSEIPQDRLGTILLMFAWPALWYMLLIYVLARPLIPAGETTPTWLRMTVLILGSGAELAAGILLLRREGQNRGRAWLRERIRVRWPSGWKLWTVAALVFIVAMALSMAASPANRALASIPGFTVPEWWGPAGNPNATVDSAADVFPDVHLPGNWGFVLIYFVTGLIFNILGEELYYRGYLQPRMHGVFGRWAWLANGILFTVKHVYQRWLYPGIAVGALSFAFAMGPLGSLPLAMLYHWAGNFLLPLILLVMSVLGIS